MADKIPATFEEAKEAARQAMLAARNPADDDATPVPQPPTDDGDDDAEESDAQNAAPSEEDEPGDTRDAEADDADDDDDEDDDDDSDDVTEDDEDDRQESDEDDDDEDADEDEPKREPKQSQKRKPSRRSKKISKLQDTIARLEADSANAEERLLKRLQEEQARRAALEAEQRQREAEDRAIESEMTEYLGTDEEYRAAVRAALNGDPFEGEKAKLWDERREIFGKLSRRAEARVNQKAAQIYWEATGSLPGVDREILSKADFGEVLKHLHTAGYSVAQSEAQKELAKRDSKIARLEAQLKSQKVVKVTKTRRDPIDSGAPVAPRKEKTIYEQSFNPDGSINREKFEALRRKVKQDRFGS